VSAPVVVGYDGSDSAHPALTRAIEEAAAAGGKLVVVAASPLPVDPSGPVSMGVLGDEVFAVPLEEPPEIERVLADARGRVEEAGIQADYVWDAGDAAAAILREAQERGAGLIVVGKGHHGRLARWLGTDVAASVEHHAGCRVLVVGD
jgi:nucleotide-binding universal stress UspA family protein